jgi:hypothetical protein
MSRVQEVLPAEPTESIYNALDMYAWDVDAAVEHLFSSADADAAESATGGGSLQQIAPTAAEAPTPGATATPQSPWNNRNLTITHQPSPPTPVHNTDAVHADIDALICSGMVHFPL